MATMLIRNLPDDMNEEGVRELLGGTEKLLSVEFLPEGDGATTRQVVVTLDMSDPEAERLAALFQGRIHEGHALRLSVMHFME